jgi:hypothetical protein
MADKRKANDGKVAASVQSGSLAGFFEELGIEHFVSGPPVGAFGLDWGPLKLSELDRAVRDSAELPLYCSLSGKATESNANEIIHPRFTCRGDTYVFNSARFKDGEFVLKVFITDRWRPDFETQYFYTVSELREIMEMPVFPELCQIIKPRLKCWLDFLIGPFVSPYMVRLKQVWRSELTYGSSQPFALAKIEVRSRHGGERLFTDLAPWPLFVDEQMMLLQLYMLSKQPGYEHPEWQVLMEDFCFSCKGFTPPSALYWGNRPFD